MNPVAFRVFNYDIRWYSIFILLASTTTLPVESVKFNFTLNSFSYSTSSSCKLEIENPTPQTPITSLLSFKILKSVNNVHESVLFSKLLISMPSLLSEF